MSAVPADSNIDVYGSTVSVAKKEEYKEQANSLGGLPTGEAQDKSGEPFVYVFLLLWYRLVGHFSEVLGAF
jgi:hypothetical protein